MSEYEKQTNRNFTFTLQPKPSPDAAVHAFRSYNPLRASTTLGATATRPASATCNPATCTGRRRRAGSFRAYKAAACSSFSASCTPPCERSPPRGRLSSTSIRLRCARCKAHRTWRLGMSRCRVLLRRSGVSRPRQGRVRLRSPGPRRHREKAGQAARCRQSSAPAVRRARLA